MPTQEEKLIIAELAQGRQGSVDEAIKDLHCYVTMLIGIVQRQAWDIREMKGSLRAIDGRLESFEQSVNTRFEVQDKKLDQILLSLAALTTKPDQKA